MHINLSLHNSKELKMSFCSNCCALNMQYIMAFTWCLCYPVSYICLSLYLSIYLSHNHKWLYIVFVNINQALLFVGGLLKREERERKKKWLSVQKQMKDIDKNYRQIDRQKHPWVLLVVRMKCVLWGTGQVRWGWMGVGLTTSTPWLTPWQLNTVNDHG